MSIASRTLDCCWVIFFFVTKRVFPLAGKVPVIQYIDPGRGDAVTHMHEIVTHMHEIEENRTITSAEERFIKWESGPEIVDDVLDHILRGAMP